MYLKSLGQSYTGIPIPDTLRNHSVPTRTASRQIFHKNVKKFVCTIFFFQTKIFLPIPDDRFCKITKKTLPTDEFSMHFQIGNRPCDTNVKGNFAVPIYRSTGI